jgi:hypothetical protein
MLLSGAEPSLDLTLDNPARFAMAFQLGFAAGAQSRRLQRFAGCRVGLMVRKAAYAARQDDFDQLPPAIFKRLQVGLSLSCNMAGQRAWHTNFSLACQRLRPCVLDRWMCPEACRPGMFQKGLSQRVQHRSSPASSIRLPEKCNQLQMPSVQRQR